MPGWKINCLKSEDGTNPSTSVSNSIEETIKTELIPSPVDQQNTDIPIIVNNVDAHSLPSSPSLTIRREQKQRRHHHSPISTLESSPSFATITPINTSTTNNSSRSSPFERHLAKYRSLPLLWLRTCGSSNHQQKRRTPVDHLGKETTDTSFGHFAIKGRTIIELIKKENFPLGLTISGGIDKDGKPKVAQLKQGSLAQKADVLEIGDFLLGINGIKTAGLKHEQVIDLIKQVGDQLTLEIEYDLPKWPIHAINTVHTKTIQIQLEKEGQSYGFILRGGASDDKVKTRPLIITKIRSQGPADKEGTIKIGDRVLAINGINVGGATLQDAHNLMRQCRGTTLFLIEYDVAIVDSVKHATGPLLIEIEKSPGSTIGISLTQKWTRTNRSIIVIDNIKPASIADRCGALHCGDQINAIDQKSFDGISLFDANAILRSCTGDFCRIEVTPSNIILDQSNDIHLQSTINRTLSNENNRQTFYRNQTMNPSLSLNNSNWTVRNSYQNIAKKPMTKTRHNSISLRSLDKLSSSTNNKTSPSVMKMYNLRELGSLNSCYQTVMGNQMCHTEIMDCVLRLDSSSSNGTILDGEIIGNFGFTLQGASFASDILMQPPVIGYLEPGGVAERSGVLQPGDRILAINGQQLEGMTLEDARLIIKESNNQIHLEIEFDVADSVMLSSGTCQVKILRKNLDLGLSVTYSRSSRADEVPLISDVKRGSIAYRCGMIQAGDRLLSIDTHSLRGKSLNEIVTLLKTCDDIVRLKIKKDDIYAEDNLSENVVVYKVQLLRQGGPLGLTISGSEDVFEPIVVSDLCEGGLADKTNAIHIGDRILAINDISLRGKGLNEAIKLLQASSDEITLKISRIINPQQKLSRSFHHPEDYTPSVDSAMESWDSSNADHRFSDNSEITKDIIVNDHQQQHSNYPDTSTNHLLRNEFTLKPHQSHSIPITINSNRSMIVIPPLSGYRTPPTNGRPLEAIRHSDSSDSIHGNERQFSTIINEKSRRNNSNFYDTKYDNCTRPTTTNRPRYDTITLILKRDKRVLDFGFSISDRLYGTGVYVNKIRPNGPAELEGTLMPCMRIYKVNNIDVTRMECNQVVPLLSSSADELTLVVGRRPAPMFDETDELFDVDEDEDEHQSAIINDNSLWNSSMNTTIHENNNNHNTSSSTTTTNNTFSLLSQAKTSTV